MTELAKFTSTGETINPISSSLNYFHKHMHICKKFFVFCLNTARIRPSPFLGTSPFALCGSSQPWTLCPQTLLSSFKIQPTNSSKRPPSHPRVSSELLGVPVGSALSSPALTCLCHPTPSPAAGASSSWPGAPTSSVRVMNKWRGQGRPQETKAQPRL